MKMLQKMRLLEEKNAFANKPIKELQVFGEQHGPVSGTCCLHSLQGRVVSAKACLMLCVM